jgi:16S rRNA (cytosine1402-N4)-methyltransferase
VSAVAYQHEPVLLQESVDALHPADALVVDCTLGGGGHTAALLDAGARHVVGIDRDAAAIEAASARLASYGDRFTAIQAPFSDLAAVLRSLSIPAVDALLADFGVSSHQLDTDERGFSFRRSGPLDMRMDRSSALTASDVVNGWTVEHLAEVIRAHGEERHSGRVARRIVAGRPWSDTIALANAVAGAIPGGRKSRIHPATRTFQALRISVNDELGEIARLLPLALDHLVPGGRMGLISFHSLEDRIVKRFIAKEAGRGQPRDPYGNPVVPPRLALGPSFTPGPDDPNPRARSARLRTATRLP